MKILIIYKGGFPNGLAMTKRLQLYAKGLKELGNDVQIIIPHASDKNGKKINLDNYGNYEGVPYRYLSRTTERSNSFLARRLNDFTGYLKILKYILTNKKNFDIVFLIDIRNTWRIPIYYLSKIKKSKIIYELNEHPLVFSSKFKFWFEKKFIYTMFDGYIVISENLKHLVTSFKKKNCQLLKVPILTNSINLDNIDLANKETSKDYIIHTGGLIEKKEGVIGFIKALHFVLNNYSQNIDLYFTGNINSSPDKENINDIIEKLGVKDNIKFLGYLSDSEVLNYQKNSLLALINKPINFQNDFCFPTKLGEYMVLAKPVLVTKVGEYMYYLKNDFNAIILEDNSPECIGKNIIKVLMNKEYYKQMGINSKNTADSVFNYKVQAQYIDTFFNSLIQ